jgi:serine/threonine protein kinase
MACLEEAEVALFFEGRLDPFHIERLERHLETCAACLSLVAAVAPALASGTVSIEPSSLLRVGDLLAGRYRVEAVLGAGASGYVYQARDQLVDTVVALKVLRPSLADDPAWVRAFIDELQVARQIVHPNVCRIFDMQQTDGHSFLTMELASGGSLREDIRRASSRPAADKLADAVALTRGLAAIHAAGIAHRDVKPANVLRTADGRVLLSDFGLARASLAAPAPSRAVGTPSYIAPEVAAGQPSSPHADVWSLGVTLHELYFGHKPADGAADATGPARDPLDRAVARLCADCLATAPAERPASGAAVLERLERLVQVPRSYLGRHRFGVALGLTALLGSCALLGQRWLKDPPPAPLVVAEVVPTLAIAPPTFAADISAADQAGIKRYLEDTGKRLARAPGLKLLPTPLDNPGPDDFTLNITVDKATQGPRMIWGVHNHVGERSVLGSVAGRPWTGSYASADPGYFDRAVLAHARRISRLRWAERSTRSTEARDALVSLLRSSHDRPERVPAPVARSALDLALKADPTYLPAHTERALALVREALGPGNNPVTPQTLLTDEARLAGLGPDDARALMARCRLLHAAITVSPDPPDALWAQARHTCERAARAPVVAPESLLTLGRLQTQACEPAAAVKSYLRGLGQSTTQHLDLVLPWAVLALREHWPHAGALDSWKRHTSTPMRMLEHDPPLQLLMGALWLRGGDPALAQVQFNMMTSRQWTLAVYQTATWEGMARAASGGWPPSDRAPTWVLEATRRPSRRSTGSSGPSADDLKVSADNELADAVRRYPATAHSSVETLAWTTPERATRLLELLPPPTTCTQAVERALIRRSLTRLRPEDLTLAPCPPSSTWVQRCQAHLRAPLGSGDPLAAAGR